MPSRPPVIQNRPKAFDPQLWRPGKGMDPARYLVFPGSVSAPGKHTPGNLRHARPYLANGRRLYVFPTGVEGFRRAGTATLGLHHYIGDETVRGVTMHYEEARITFNGLFPGLTAQQNMVECISMLRSHTLTHNLTLYAPGVFNNEQRVLPESWDFSHEPDDRTHSIEYTITFVRVGEGKAVKDPVGTPPPTQAARTTVKGKPARIYTVRANARTLKAIAKIVYNAESKWRQLIALNPSLPFQFAEWKELPADFALPTARLIIGTKLRY